ncbi:MAG: DUF1015 domain-containing protein [Clostridia bacterium]|nr:DUF1015 domain-containing protein [Clostridia bacterium]
MPNTFHTTNVLLPRFDAGCDKWESWSVIACDQYTSEPEYWESVDEITGGAPSTLGLILPEAYLSTDLKDEKLAAIKKNSDALCDGYLKEYSDSMVYVERTLASGKIRRGLVGAIALDAYSFEKGAICDVRPTEGTVKERIPPRVEVRRASVYEASHVMLFGECSDVFDLLTSKKDNMPVLYDFDLMLSGGHITGRLVSGEILSKVSQLISEYENERRKSGAMIYGVGDGNHSLASAKAYLEEVRMAKGDDSLARDALVELVPITDGAIVFEPIYKTVVGADFTDLISYIKGRAAENEGKETLVTAYCGAEKTSLSIPVSDSEILCGVLQGYIDDYISLHGGKCDYIHGKENLIALTKDGVVGFVFDGIDKSDLFPYVSKNGVLPRKTFSMGEACEKRYYTELRRIK